ncbi:PTS system N-acetylglucosamine-specific IIB component, Glc family /PTS system N-acetylglucosamine-specific IIC component, Glc family [Sphingomonas gellani]|uniref:PTS system N-acetylglucosamine-specific IIB component, Glc family /PTS system N-acetylglucosamine-specific IIC component, Glc family n=1 Tax=Sphingomonas gellani TaxID=1166340 RepID=A0A1H8D0C6_9SPHN|nr:N-acetylglucosamine-specific PTS transporter subunit IIBC [Sphingomonas gellani]SEN00094.1 PTS system N-acetylglucosamine-specific IIB component, Glc family /PTS system N-acetylglucosamine-specific IIC component, Glc family [Sphingomonas gellani]
MKAILGALQPLGRALMLPIAVLPIAGLLLRLGQPDLLNIAFVSAAGEAIFSHLGLLFAVGVATGFARDGNGAAAMGGMVCYLVSGNGAQALIDAPASALSGVPDTLSATVSAAWKAAAIAKLDVPVGILSGLAGGLLYNRFSAVKLPDYLAFFGGRRSVPILAGFTGLLFALVLGESYGAISGGMDALSGGVVAAGGWGLFAFGLLNRLLLVTGLHHILNNVAYFVVGDYHGKTGDLTRFFAGDPSAGGFMSGFFPVMMFGLPAACLAMYHETAPDRRKAVGGLLLSLALTSFLTGVTEPIEFSFMFLAPALYAIHAVLTGLAEAVMNALGVRLGYGFSAGLFDYVLNFGKATRPLLLLPVGLVWFALYYGLFRFFIRRFDLPTPGREAVPAAEVPAQGSDAGGRGGAFARALGGSANLQSVDACTTRLRLVVRDQAAVDEAALKALGARGLIRPSDTALQVVLGPMADMVADEIRAVVAAGGDVAQPLAQAAAAEPELPLELTPSLTAALGGMDNVLAGSRHHGRLRVHLKNADWADEGALSDLGIRALAHPANGVLHLLADDTTLATLAGRAALPA